MTHQTSPIFGRLDWSVTPYTDLLEKVTSSTIVGAGAATVLVVGAIGAVALLTWMRWWKPLFQDWLTSADAKKIGIMYIVLALVMLARGIIEGFVMRAHQATALGTLAEPESGLVAPDHFAQLFSTHGTIMIFFVAMPLLIGLINFVLPQQLGARDMAFPVLNQVSLSMTAAGAGLIMISLLIGQFGTGGWTMYPPYTGIQYSPGEGVDYWLWAIMISGVGSTLTGMNFAVTIFKKRAPGMHFMRMPLFCWTSLCVAIMLIYAMPALTVSSSMLLLDRYAGFHFFTNAAGGNMMNYANIFWMFGHPEVYILVLPAFGVFSEISSTFSGKKLYGYTSLVIASMSISVISFTVWLHHFFTMGSSVPVNIAFGIATMIIGIPTGVKVYDWMATMWRGRIRVTTPIVYLVGFFMLFVIGGLSGIILANPSIDYQVHNSTFLVAHFHNVIIPGVLFGMLAGIHYWFPKAFGFRLSETWGRLTAYLFIGGFLFTFMPLYVLGLMGMPRRSPTFQNPEFLPWMYIAAFGGVLMLVALASLVWTFWTSWRNRERLAVPGGDPWNGATLEWSSPAPVPEWNFPLIPVVTARDDWGAAKRAGDPWKGPDEYVDIEMPANTYLGVVLAGAAFLLGFAMTWHIWWLSIASLLAMVATIFWRGIQVVEPVIVPAEEVERADKAFRERVANLPSARRAEEETEQNRGVPDITEFAG
ncbi:cbb3-type cytochrome c oxidase subunit I [Hyphomonas sp.]|uniref:cbb3-type cytochrome c oxidase subunit I n=1 Tax=Hyphomonas sp. TaxID=87 RepID=UPI000C42B8D5|nr:cbb3-type cytochrome c oxidase subunit I [Hyphomonas sp.]MAB09442.1 cytochrome ubiquinol oxidase subunit I [Hyphomonas sp.]MAU68388.1 cytochrome ubiquinol oxidase subunit I [Hyphomonas sp.]MBM59712.1 cytochrome ubiquinol oxidase subunit I [Hyphomonas sp.]